jgi:hypothetical protein
MPPINLTNNVDAKDYFYYTLQTAVANRGYYSFPPLLSYEVLQQESAYDSELFLESDIAAFRRTFGADLLLFTKITNWKKHPVGGKVDVEIEIWNHEQLVVLNEIILNDLEIIHEQQVVRIKMLL